jgi:hypothetical protein
VAERFNRWVAWSRCAALYGNTGWWGNKSLRVHLEWKENQVRSMLIQSDTAVELTDFVIQGTPKKQGQPFLFRGRAMVVYVRYKDSPTGCASIREIIQPAT